MDDATDFLVAANDGIELAFPRELREVARIALQRLIFFFRIWIGDFLSPANRHQHLEDGVLCYTVRLEQTAGGLAFGVAQGNQKVFGADVFVFELIGFFKCVFKNAIEPGTHVDLLLPLDLGQLRHVIRQAGREHLKVHAELLKDRQNILIKG